MPADPTPSETGRLALNVMQFCRALRAAGLPVGPGRTLAALEALETVGIASRQDVYWALHATLVNRRDQREVFDQAFHLFWRNPDMLKRAMTLMLPQIRTGKEEERAVNRRVAEAFADRQPGRGEAPDDAEEPPELEVDASLTFSEREQLQHKDFEQMSAEELARARAAIARLRLPVRDVPTRRYAPHHSAPLVDMRQTLRQSLRAGGHSIDLARRIRRKRPPPLVVLCDISGSMSQYSRMLLHFLHAVTTERDRVHSFVFGTRLTNIARQLRRRDVDDALDRVGRAAQDWGGGTRIGACLAEFNRVWGRRVLGQGAVVILITDGLDRDAGDRLEDEIDRLHRSCRRLIWLNPLLRWDGYAPRSMGARALMPHVDEFRPVHSLASLAALVDVLAEDPMRGDRRMARWRHLAAAQQELVQ
ncbi:vWA domain-containing protein [Inquilinus limosus]|uniref:VWA domain-containing protein n=1 Tax=Inquilinus limosus TaxID=171674 RepID=A0A211ZEW9_9PROT|nr:VWA domain-containing protein [Inquilinus limosus]OWJ63842.1 VWA domain-containing protein [Inquilinus limosus]